MKKEKIKNILTGIFGNIFEHYGNALFALLVPFISQIFFPSYSKIDGLIFTYSVLCLGIIFRPLGALIFGYIGDSGGRKKALAISLFGSAAACLLFAFVPSYERIGWLAPITIAFIKSLQGFFSAGETPLGAIYVVEKAKEKSLMSSIYDASSILGIFLASFGVFILSYFEIIDNFWRILFVIGSVTAFIGFFLRRYPEEKGLSQVRCNITDIFKIIRENFISFSSILIVSGFSYSLYYFSFIFLCGYIPLISNISESDCMKINSFILLIDFCALPLVGFIAQKLSKEKLMLWAALLISISSLPLFYLLQDSNIITSTSIRILFVLMGVLFSAPLHHLALELSPEIHRSKIISLGYAFGSQLIGLPSSAISLWLYKKSNLVYAPGIYLTIFGLISFIILARYYFLKSKVQNNISSK